MPFNVLVLSCLIYVIFLFSVAFVVERRAAQGRLGFLRSPVIYTLSLSIYCTAWTFYGAVGYAARSGLEFVTIYLGPTLVFVGWWFVLRKLVRISHTQRLTSIADLLSSRFGKSSRLAVLVTVIAVIGIVPYISIQLKAVDDRYPLYGQLTLADGRHLLVYNHSGHRAAEAKGDATHDPEPVLGPEASQLFFAFVV